MTMWPSFLEAIEGETAKVTRCQYSPVCLRLDRSPACNRAALARTRVMSSNAPVGLPWQSATAFLRIATNPKMPGQRFTLQEAVALIDLWIGQPNLQLLAPGDRHWSLLRGAIVDGQARGPLITDAELAALTIEVGGVLHTTDRDFARFPPALVQSVGIIHLLLSTTYLEFGFVPQLPAFNHVP